MPHHHHLDPPAAPDALRLEHIPAIEGLRAVAVIAVVVYHMDFEWARGGFLGVDLFFTLSGFLITRLLLVEYGRTGRIAVASFYDKRFRRLLPAALTMIAAVVAVVAIHGSVLTDQLRLADVRATLAYVANWHFIATAQDYFETGPDISPLRHMWSLAVEEQFYVVWPLVTWAVLAIGTRDLTAGARRLGVVAAVLAAASATAFAARYSPGMVSRAYFGTDTRAFQMLAGAIAAVIERALVAQPARSRPIAARHRVVVAGVMFAAVVCAFATVDAQSSTYYRGLGLAFTACAAVLVFHLARAGCGALGRVLASRPLTSIGALSYGIYLWHWPIILWLQVPPGASGPQRSLVHVLQATATLAAAYSSYHLVENPIRRGSLATRLRPATRLVALAVPVGALAVAATVLLQPPAGGGTDDILAATSDTSVVSCPGDAFPCLVEDFRRGSDGPTVAIVGDSTAQAFTLGILDAAERHGWRVVQAARGACPVGHLLVQYGPNVTPNERQVQCHEMHDQIFTDLLDDYDPDVILVASVSDRLTHVTDGEIIEVGTERHLDETAAALRDAYAMLTAGGAGLVVVQPFPPGFGVDCFEREGTEEQCFRTIADDRPHLPYKALTASVAAELGGDAAVVDLGDRICQADGCPLRVDGVVVRYDGTHLTGTMSRLLGPEIEAHLLASMSRG